MGPSSPPIQNCASAVVPCAHSAGRDPRRADRVPCGDYGVQLGRELRAGTHGPDLLQDVFADSESAQGGGESGDVVWAHDRRVYRGAYLQVHARVEREAQGCLSSLFDSAERGALLTHVRRTLPDVRDSPVGLDYDVDPTLGPAVLLVSCLPGRTQNTTTITEPRIGSPKRRTVQPVSPASAHLEPV